VTEQQNDTTAAVSMQGTHERIVQSRRSVNTRMQTFTTADAATSAQFLNGWQDYTRKDRASIGSSTAVEALVLVAEAIKNLLTCD